MQIQRTSMTYLIDLPKKLEVTAPLSHTPMTQKEISKNL
jgi:hypothetical protein